MAGESKVTTDHEEIKKWAEERRGVPVLDKEAETGKGKIGTLQICFPDYNVAGKNKLEEISWEEFFETFDDNGLLFVYRDLTSDGERSRFFKLIRLEWVPYDV